MKPLTLCVSIVLVFLATGCKKDDTAPVAPPNPSTGATTYIGTLANPAESGSITLLFSSAVGRMISAAPQSVESVVTVSGSIKVNGAAAIPIAGAYNTATDSLVISGGGYTFAGVLSGGHITGSYSGPRGPGSFTASPSTAEGSVKVYCGTFHELSPDSTRYGRFNLVVSGTAVTGITEDGTQLGGSVSGSTVTVTITGIQIATGTISGASITGTFMVPTNPPASGTWEASICQ